MMKPGDKFVLLKLERNSLYLRVGVVYEVSVYTSHESSYHVREVNYPYTNLYCNHDRKCTLIEHLTPLERALYGID